MGLRCHITGLRLATQFYTTSFGYSKRSKVTSLAAKQIDRSRLLFCTMNKLVRLFVIVVAAAALSHRSAVAQNPVVVELFTSEGCSSCPPADALLLQLSRQGTIDGVPLVLLGEHVDYWNYIGWTDRFSTSQFSRRQNAYAKALPSSVYTPQMVIDGRTQFVGNDAAEVAARIAAAAKDAKPAQVSLAWEAGGSLHVSIHSAKPTDGAVLLAVTEDGLSTAVANGENGGHTLHHAAVVRRLSEVGDLRDGSFDRSLEVPVPSEWNRSQLKAIVLVQDPKTMKMLGAGQIDLLH